MAYSYRDIIKLKFPDKTPQKFLNNTYAGIVWNALDTTPNPTQAELDAAIAEAARVETFLSVGTTVTTVDVPSISGTTLIPYDNTIPTITEGTEILSLSFKPASFNSQVVIIGSLIVDSSTSNKNITLALFRGSTCIGVTTMNLTTAGRLQPFPFKFTDANLGLYFGGTDPVYSIRIGAGSSTIWYINRGATALFNGMLAKNSVLFLGYN